MRGRSPLAVVSPSNPPIPLPAAVSPPETAHLTRLVSGLLLTVSVHSPKPVVISSAAPLSPNFSNVNVLYTNETNPTRFHQFTQYGDSLIDLGAGHYCPIFPNFGSLGYQAGQDVTLLVLLQVGDTLLSLPVRRHKPKRDCNVHRAV